MLSSLFCGHIRRNTGSSATDTYLCEVTTSTSSALGSPLCSSHRISSHFTNISSISQVPVHLCLLPTLSIASPIPAPAAKQSIKPPCTPAIGHQRPTPALCHHQSRARGFRQLPYITPSDDLPQRTVSNRETIAIVLNLTSEFRLLHRLPRSFPFLLQLHLHIAFT